jgi:hypothetical protein
LTYSAQFGTNVLTALGIAIGTAGAPVVLNGAGGTPSAITLTNGTGLPVGTGILSAAYSSSGTTDQGTKNINIDGAAYARYAYGPGTGTAGTYTTVITAGPSSGERYIFLDLVGGTNGIGTITWTNVTAIGAALGASVTATKTSSYACIVATSTARCKVVAENY